MNTQSNYNNIKIDEEWEWYIAQLFFNIAQKSQLAPKVVVEIGPGYRHKVAIMLSQMNFDGELYVVDNNKNVLEFVEKKYTQLLPKAKIICIHSSFEKSIDNLPKKIDLLLANHIVDDMLLENYISKSKYNSMLDSAFLADSFVMLWEEFSKDKSQVESSIQFVCNAFEKFVKQNQIDFAIISQYKSNLFLKDKSTVMENITQNCFEKIKTLFVCDDKKTNDMLDTYPFGDDERYLGKELLDNTQNAKNWIVGKTKGE